MTAIRRTPLHEATVVRAEPLTPRLRRITLQVPTLEPPRPAQDVELILTDDTGRKVKRRYTIRHYRADGPEIDLDAILHGHGPGARWAAAARPGDRISFFGPRGRLALTGEDWHLFLVDESALPAAAALVEALPTNTAKYVLAEVDGPDEELAIPGAQVRWLHRGSTPPGTPDLLDAALADFSAPAGDGHGYLLGESRVIAALRPRLHALGLPNERLYVKGYWNVGRPARR